MPNIIGLFDSRREAESAVQHLVNSGIERDNISIVSRNHNEDTRDSSTDDDNSGAAKGAGIGAALGGVGGLLAGLAGTCDSRDRPHPRGRSDCRGTWRRFGWRRSRPSYGWIDWCPNGYGRSGARGQAL